VYKSFKSANKFLAISQSVLLSIGDQALPDLQAKLALHDTDKLIAIDLSVVFVNKID
jgi:hypothetical protein